MLFKLAFGFGISALFIWVSSVLLKRQKPKGDSWIFISQGITAVIFIATAIVTVSWMGVSNWFARLLAGLFWGAVGSFAIICLTSEMIPDQTYDYDEMSCLIAMIPGICFCLMVIDGIAWGVVGLWQFLT